MGLLPGIASLRVINRPSVKAVEMNPDLATESPTTWMSGAATLLTRCRVRYCIRTKYPLGRKMPQHKSIAAATAIAQPIAFNVLRPRILKLEVNE